MNESNEDTMNQNSPRSAGALLKAEREKKAISLESAAAFLRLRKAMVIALEDDDYAQWSSWVYFRGHLQRYAQWLGLDFALVKDALSSECAEFFLSKADCPNIQPVSIWKKNAKVIVFSVFVLLVLLLILLGLGIYHWFHISASASDILPALKGSGHDVVLSPVKESM